MSSARVYPTERIRNVVVLGHGGSGKTSLVEALCFVSGTAKRHGSVREGNTLTMHTPAGLGIVHCPDFNGGGCGVGCGIGGGSGGASDTGGDLSGVAPGDKANTKAR